MHWARRIAHGTVALLCVALDFLALFLPLWFVKETGSWWYLLMYLGSAIVWISIYTICEGNIE